MEVKIIDRDAKTEMLRLALNCVDFGIDYWATVLLLRIQAEQKKKGGQFSIMDAAKIRATWEAERTEYDEKNTPPTNK